jgi:hypothetical protein
MANPNAKSGSDWTTNDLLLFKIRVSAPQSPEEFYGQPLPTVASLSGLDSNLLFGTLGTQGLSDETYRLLQYLDLASKANSGQESAVHDFTREILRSLGYEKRGLLLRSHYRSRYAIPLLGCGEPNISAQADVCLVQGSSTTILMVVQEDKDILSARDPAPQVIAEAIATLQYNNRIRARAGQSELDSMTIPCITMTGTRPIFYLVPVTRNLSEAVATSMRFSLSPTVVQKCVVTSSSHRLSEGMETPDFRQVALQHFAAFRTLAEAHWSAFTIPVEMETSGQVQCDRPSDDVAGIIRTITWR